MTNALRMALKQLYESKGLDANKYIIEDQPPQEEAVERVQEEESMSTTVALPRPTLPESHHSTSPARSQPTPLTTIATVVSSSTTPPESPHRMSLA